MYKNRTNLIFILSIIAMVTSLATFVLFFKIIANKNEHTSATLLVLANKIAKKENIDTLSKTINDIEEARKTVNKYFVDPTTIDSFIDYLEKLGQDANTVVKVENFDVPTTNKNTILVTISSKGTFTNVMRTLEILENTPYQIHITKTALIKQPESGNIDEKTGSKISNQQSLWQASISFSVLTS